jgi:predicted transcriptional regulator
MALSKVQTKRLGVLLATMFKEEVSQELADELVKNGFLEKVDKGYVLTSKGLDEKNRLCTLAGLNIQYRGETKSRE